MADILYNTSAVLALIAIILAAWRLLKGPNVADRVVALDVMTIISISLIVYVASIAQRVIYLDVAMVYALISFIGVVAIARYLERGL
ncbi:cation:proton antiporter [bacterium]|nr:cation:proton antiporter [bacterium]MBU1064474.1 cation:proton antiporter [bacterium]MBU1633293.1 cation:proton antiporter [bacterium]MBU1874725.1 cation:proton antiporter [bacterium]